MILTDENRLRLNGCAILDVVDGQGSMELPEQQSHDLQLFGNLVLALGTNNASNTHFKTNPSRALELFRRYYSPRMCSSLIWLLDHANQNTGSIDIFLASVSGEIISSLDHSLSANDTLTKNLNRELENSRLVRLVAKINTILGRTEHDRDRNWSEQGKYHPLVLIRDYIFHSVDAQGRAALDLGHVIGCLNKLDVGLEERVLLISRDEQSQIVMSWREVRALVESAWADLMRRNA